jgi:hypothetical protein
MFVIGSFGTRCVPYALLAAAGLSQKPRLFF